MFLFFYYVFALFEYLPTLFLTLLLWKIIQRYEQNNRGEKRDIEFNDNLGSFIYDINFIMDGNPSARNKLFFILNNWRKGKLLHKTISDALLFQSTKYAFDEDLESQLYVWQSIFNNKADGNLDTLFQTSLKIEPRNCSRGDVE